MLNWAFMTTTLEVPGYRVTRSLGVALRLWVGNTGFPQSLGIAQCIKRSNHRHLPDDLI